MNVIALWGTAFGLIILGISETKNTAIVILLLIITLVFNAGVFNAFLINHVDISPNFCGTLMGISNSLASITSLMGPLAVGWIVTDTVSMCSTEQRSC